ncbi:hypothetical protein [Ligilactobacillus apodemi]|uniref:Uncharacterized protein n=1 Tax=Ligilactobacillus apodemi DSM 16634 = JCM 16172 TaxID=1423724 RepID=A0A0R1TQS5_9LACO|nr:hypothetical protein [Ligilactobacillus apodemi]KRL83809.1 hypothetical protein FC32_GL001071 [Ligilactobacillus apodemi DSM 16634 = JCM 16172]
MVDKTEFEKKLYQQQEELENEYLRRKKQYEQSQENIARIAYELNNIYAETTGVTRQVLGKLEAENSSFSKLEQINAGLSESSQEVYRRQRKKLDLEWEEYQVAYRKKQDMLAEKFSKYRRDQ